MGRIIAVANQKGGVGKTTTNVNISACLAEKGKRVLAVDIDPQGNTTSGFGIDSRQAPLSIYDILINGASAEAAIKHTAFDNVDIIVSKMELAGAEVELVNMMARETVLKRALAAVRDTYDYIFIDCPPSLGLITLNALTAADKVLVPIQCEYYALEGLSQLMNTIKLVKQHLNPGLEIEGVVLTMFDGRTNLSMQVVDEVKRYFRDKVYCTIVPRNIRLGEAPSHGLPINHYAPDCPGAEAYRDLAQEMIDHEMEVI